MKIRNGNSGWLISSLLLSLLCLFLAAPNNSAIAADEVVFAAIDDLSGPYAADGQEFVKAWELAFEEINYTILGKKINFIKADTQLKPAVAVRKFRELVEQNHPICVASGCSSAVQLAMQEVAGDTKTIFWTGGWSSKLTSAGSVNRYTFRWASPNFAIARSSVDGFMKKFPAAKKFFFITMDYQWGHDMTNEATTIIKKNGGQVLGNVFTPLRETDYSGAITKALAAKPDVIMLNQYGSPLIKSARAIHDFGAKEKVKILIPGDGLTMLRGIGSEALQGMYVGTHWYHTLDTPFSKKFVADFKKKYNKIPSYYAMSFYLMAKLTLDAMKRAGSTTDSGKIICQLEDHKYEGPHGKEVIRAFDHQVIHPYLLTVGKKPSDKKYDDDYLEILSSAGIYRSKEENPVVWKIKLPCDSK